VAFLLDRYIYQYMYLDNTMLIATKVIQVRPDTKRRFREYVEEGQTADRALNEMLDRIDELKNDMGF